MVRIRAPQFVGMSGLLAALHHIAGRYLRIRQPLDVATLEIECHLISSAARPSNIIFRKIAN